ncbi:hypothetical protein [Catellatospora methionotrophica]|uniref:hypothetical protein n=1 Tax=Catellatospora methionotrophica TaxID=121620 RepID=UPI0033F47FD4
MTASPARLAAVFLTLAIGGCTPAVQPDASVTPKPVIRESAEVDIPVPMLGVGESFGADLRGDGHATITVTAAEVSTLSPDRVRLVVTVAILLDKAGDPITGGPENFRFLDTARAFYKAKTNTDMSGPALPSVPLTTTGQRSGGRFFFDLPATSARGGYLQLMTGNLVHAIWKI